MVPTQMRRLQLRRASAKDSRWLHKTLDRECRPLGARVAFGEDNALTLKWK